MRRADRLFQIIQLLRGTRKMTAEDIGGILEVSVRTVYRDIADLKSHRVPIDGEAGVGYILRPGHDIPPLMFTPDEIMSLVAGARLITAWGGAEMAEAAAEALIKIEDVLPPEERRRMANVEIHAPTQLGPDHRILLDQLTASTKKNNLLEISYSDGTGLQSNRTIRPLALWYWGKVWTLAAWCELREDFRLFRIDRIDRMIESEVTYLSETGKGLTDYHKLLEARGELLGTSERESAPNSPPKSRKLS